MLVKFKFDKSKHTLGFHFFISLKLRLHVKGFKIVLYILDFSSCFKKPVCLIYSELRLELILYSFYILCNLKV